MNNEEKLLKSVARYGKCTTYKNANLIKKKFGLSTISSYWLIAYYYEQLLTKDEFLLQTMLKRIYNNQNVTCIVENIGDYDFYKFCFDRVTFTEKQLFAFINDIVHKNK